MNKRKLNLTFRLNLRPMISINTSGPSLNYRWADGCDLATLMLLVTTNVYGRTATVVGVYSASSYTTDVGMRADVAKVETEDLTIRLSAGVFKVIEAPLDSHSFTNH